MTTNFIFIPTEDHQTLGRRGQWMCVHCCRFVEFSAEGFSGHMKACEVAKLINETPAPKLPKAPVTPLLLFQ